MKPGTSSVSLTIMYAMISLVLVYCACIFVNYQLLFYFIASVPVMGVMVEKHASLFIAFYAIVIGGAMLLIPDRSYILPYLFFFGYYAIIKYILDIAVKKTLVNILIKVGLFTLCGFILYIVHPVLFLSYFPEGLQKWVFILILEGIFVGYDILFRYLTLFYLGRIRTNLKRSTY